MSVPVDIRYEGDLFCVATHGPSGHSFRTEAPLDNGGKGTEFSPTDLVGTALGTCMVTIMGIFAQRHGLDIVGTQVHVEKEMAAQPRRRIGLIRVAISVPPEKGALLTETQRDRLEEAARRCPVHASLHPDTHVDLTFEYGAPPASEPVG